MGESDGAALNAAESCDGSSDCLAALHIHGCYADQGDCDEPDEHDPREVVPVGLEHDV